MEVFFGYLGALAIGLVLGLTGGGGSILTVPVLVYLLGIHPVTATAYSLFIVGTTSAFGTVQNYRKGFVEVKTGLKFALPSLTAIYLTRKFIVPNIPEVLFSIGEISITKNLFIMILFAIIMLMAALSMIRNNKSEKSTVPPNPIITVVQIFMVGVLIGLVGAGGGFLIIPALVYLAKLPMKKAVGTSIFIIAINSLIGFTGDIGNIDIDWSFLFIFSFISILGIFAGIYLNKFINEKNLKKGFGWFVLTMSILILAKELLL
ncbi:sulfite exporter TauE/SafE family protein [Flavobacterium microcysteis]|uniref:Probable membrane transporter protein n=1 Tax=Flavobacterium microcysteis TaxID=2596891 RepID=A0A501Q4M4_9FLAO|nr:sulfite exporter TauE/SafE family protein [Flavobacterium microcysteis]TPD67284.1 sulfite exporter TauE/SafE family protein [Flavobacterium microcysteis]